MPTAAPQDAAQGQLSALRPVTSRSVELKDRDRDRDRDPDPDPDQLGPNCPTYPRPRRVLPLRDGAL
jgi:hypothetical protein